MINVVYASDNNYAPYLAVSLNSLILNNSNESINIFILDNNISENNKDYLKILISKNNNFQIKFISTKKFENSVNISKSQIDGLLGINLTSYSRLLLSSILPNDIEKVIYIDCDSLIVDNIRKLWEINIDKYMCAGVLDTTPTYFKEIVGLNDEDEYINAGMLLINLKKWREENVEKHFLNFLENKYGKNIHHDQGVINGVLKNKILIIHPKYNLLGPFHGKDYDFVKKWFGISYDYYNKEIIEEAQKNPVFIHFSGGSIERPWANKKHYYKSLYDKYVEKSGYDKTKIYQVTGSISTIGKLYVAISENRTGRFIMDIIPIKWALYFKNYIVNKQSKN